MYTPTLHFVDNPFTIVYNVNEVECMKISSRFAVAVHALLAIYALGDKYKMTSDFIASSVNVNPVIIRRTLLSLKAAGIISVKSGSGGAVPLKNAADVSLYDIYTAVDCLEGSLFNFHENPNPECPVGKNIHSVLDSHLESAQRALENELKKTSFEDLMKKLDSLS